MRFSMNFFVCLKTLCTKHIRISLLAIFAASLLLAVFPGLPNNPFSIIAGVKGNKEKRELINLPVSELSKVVSVSSCSDSVRQSVHSSAADFTSASSGLKVFKARLSKEFKTSNNSFNSLALKILNQTAKADNQTSSCLLPLVASAKKSLSVEISSSSLLAVSLGSETVYCSNSKAYLLSKPESSAFYPLSDSLKDYAANIKDRKVLANLKNQLNKQKILLTTNKSKKAQTEQNIRKLNLAISQAQYFSSEALLLGSFFNAVCSQIAAIATPVAQGTVFPTKVPAPTNTAASANTPPALQCTPVVCAAPNKLVCPNSSCPGGCGIVCRQPTPTFTPTPTTEPGRLLPPAISSPTGSVVITNSSTVTVSWNSVPGADAYLLGAVDKTNPAKDVDLVYIENHSGTTYNLAVSDGYKYRFWVRARKSAYNPEDKNTFSNLSEIIFEVQGSNTRTPTPTPTATGSPLSDDEEPGDAVQRTVSPGGSITACINQSAPGDSCIVSSGVYNEVIKPSSSGLALYPITVKPATGADVKVEGLDLDSVVFVDFSGLKFRSFTRDLITWKLDNYYLGGTYVNGDPWVKGPVTLTGFNQMPQEDYDYVCSCQCPSVSPQIGGVYQPITVPCWCPGGMVGQPNSHICTSPYQWVAQTYYGRRSPSLGTDESGSQLNINPEQRVKQGLTKNDGWVAGLDDHPYDSSLNLALQLPKTITVSAAQPVQSLLSTSAGLKVGYAFSHAAVLTVVYNEPGSREFRPPYSGPVKITTPYNLNNALSRVNLLKSKAPPSVAALPDVNQLVNDMKKLVVEKSATNNMKSGSYFKSHGTAKHYGVDISARTSKAALFLQTNASREKKAKIMVYLLQYGLDLYGGMTNNLQFVMSGGHQNGKLVPFYMAVRLLGLGDDKLQRYSARFNEINQQGYSTYQGRIIPEWGRPGNPGEPNVDVTEAAPFPNARSWTTNPDGSYNGYRFTSNGGHTGAVLAMMLMEDNNRSALKSRLGGGTGYSRQNGFIDYIIDVFYPIQTGNPKAQIRSEPKEGVGVGTHDNDINIFTHTMWQAYGPN